MPGEINKRLEILPVSVVPRRMALLVAQLSADAPSPKAA
jgi:hypothetical protein